MPVIAVSVPAAQVAQDVVVVVSEDWGRPTLPVPKPGAPEAPVKPVELTDKRISQAVAETLKAAPAPTNQQDALRGQVLSGDTSKSFTKAIAYAKVPDCQGEDGLKFQPPQIGPIVFSGLFTLPFMVVAKVRGKCK